MAKQRTNNSSGNKLIVYEGPEGDTAQSDSYTNESQFLNERWSPGAVGTIHRFSDLDSAQIAQHHTLGPRHNQSAPGDHTHNGTTSKALGIWQDYPISWGTQSGGTAPSLGSGILIGRYMQIGGTVFGRITFKAVSGTTSGSGEWTFSMPPVPILLNPEAGAGNPYEGGIGSAIGFNGVTGSGATQQPVTPYHASVAADLWLGYVQIVGENGVWQSNVPFSWAGGSGFQASFMYEAKPL